MMHKSPLMIQPYAKVKKMSDDVVLHMGCKLQFRGERSVYGPPS